MLSRAEEEQDLILAGTTGSMTYTYDENMDNAPTASNFGNNIRTKSQYDKLGRLSIYAAMNEKNTYPYTASYSYLSNPSDSTKTSGVVSGITYRFADIPSLSYTYDKNGNITKITSPSDSGIEFNYTYDKHDQLLSAYSKKDGYYINYVYDYGGNITSKKYYNALNPSMLEKTVSYEYNDSNWKDKLTKYDGKPITYDSVGNMLTFDSQTFTWLGRRLTNYAKGSTSAAYSYNSDGIRTKKTVGSAATEYMLNGSQILAEQTGSTMIKYFYDSDGKRASFKTGNKYYFYVYNLQGDVTHIVDTDGNVVATYEYDPYGKILNLDSLTAIGKVNPFRYRGYYYDSESNLYYLNSRYYNPEIGRFINTDSQLNQQDGVIGFNLFAYCGNNPINRDDQSGHFWIPTIIKKAAKAIVAVSVVVKIVCTVKEYKRVKKELGSLPKPTADITNSFRETLKTNANTVKETTKKDGIIESGKQFYNKVRNKGEWDLKQLPEYDGAFKFNDLVIEGQDIGNINFGYTGKALGLPDSVLLAGAGIAQIMAGTSNFSFIMASNGDDLRDQMYIMYGIKLYKEDNRG